MCLFVNVTLHTNNTQIFITSTSLYFHKVLWISQSVNHDIKSEQYLSLCRMFLFDCYKALPRPWLPWMTQRSPLRFHFHFPACLPLLQHPSWPDCSRGVPHKGSLIRPTVCVPCTHKINKNRKEKWVMCLLLLKCGFYACNVEKRRVVFKSHFQFGELFSFVARILCINELRKEEFMEFRALKAKWEKWKITLDITYARTQGFWISFSYFFKDSRVWKGGAKERDIITCRHWHLIKKRKERFLKEACIGRGKAVIEWMKLSTL